MARCHSSRSPLRRNPPSSVQFVVVVVRCPRVGYATCVAFSRCYGPVFFFWWATERPPRCAVDPTRRWTPDAGRVESVVPIISVRRDSQISRTRARRPVVTGHAALHRRRRYVFWSWIFFSFPLHVGFGCRSEGEFVRSTRRTLRTRVLVILYFVRDASEVSCELERPGLVRELRHYMGRIELQSFIWFPITVWICVGKRCWKPE